MTNEYKKYKLVYDAKTAIKGSISGIPSKDDKEIITDSKVADCKLVYEKDAKLNKVVMGSTKNIPTTDDVELISVKDLEGETLIEADKIVPATPKQEAAEESLESELKPEATPAEAEAEAEAMPTAPIAKKVTKAKKAE